MPQHTPPPPAETNWDPVAAWYARLVGKEGSTLHQRIAIPALLELLAPRPGEAVLEIGSGPGTLASYVTRAKAAYTGVDASRRLLEVARARHGGEGRFLLGDARHLPEVPGLEAASFDAAIFFLSLQDIDPLEPALRSAAWALRPHGRLVVLMTHPCFRIPRQSGWGWDAGRKLQYRRIDRYLTPLPVPVKPYPGGGGATTSFHRPLQTYLNALVECGYVLEHVREIPADPARLPKRLPRAQALAFREIPLFFGLRAHLAPPAAPVGAAPARSARRR